MRRHRAAVALAASFVLVTAACGGSSDVEDVPESTATTELPTDAATTAEPDAGADTETDTGTDTGTDAETGTAAPDAADVTVLIASVGEEGDPDAFVISLTDEAGQPVTDLPAGDYEVQVDDPSEIHNFALRGPGVEEATTVPEVTQVTWQVTLEAGSYEFICDPHPNMVGDFTVS